MATAHITLARLREQLTYYPCTGIFIWRVDRKRARSGSVAGYIHSSGRVYIGLDGTNYLAHRLAWFFVTGKWPKKEIDHKDGNSSNNRFDNLRLATRFQNNQNQRRAHADNLCGFLGVSRNGYSWVASIQNNKQRIHLGSFDTPKDAHNAYRAAKKKLHAFSTI